MSINLHLEATKLVSGGRGKQIRMRDTFPLLQTPSYVTEEIITLKTIQQQMNAYLGWVRKNVDDKMFVIEHGRKLNEWINVKTQDGNDIAFYAM